MASILLKQALLFTCAIFACVWIAQASDPDILSDFVVPANNTNTVDGNLFTYTGFRIILTSDFPTTLTVTKASLAEFSVLNGQSVSYAVIQFPAGAVNPPHIHPRASELLFVVAGSLEFGFIDTTNKLYTQTLQLGDIFVFPKGLVHYQYNADPKEPAMAVSAFASANAGTFLIPTTLFGTDVDVGILAKSFKTNVPTIQKIKAGLTPKS